MKTRNRPTKLLATSLALVVLSAVWGARPARAIIIIGTKTGLFGVAAGQKVRTSFVNLAQKRVGIVPCTKVFDIDGNMIAEHEGMPLQAGQGAFFDFDAGRLGLRPGERAQIRVEVVLEQPPDPTQPPDPAQPPDPTGPRDRIRPDAAAVTVEVFDSDTGKTTLTLNAALKGFNPQPEPPTAGGN